MSRRARQLRRRRSRGGSSRLIFGTLGMLAAVLVLGVGAGVGYIVSLASSGSNT